MLYTVSESDRSQDLPLISQAPRRVFHRTRAAVKKVAPGRPILAVALSYDATRGEVFARGRSVRGGSPSWTAPALVDRAGGVTVLAPVPAALVRAIEMPSIRVHIGSGAIPRPRLADLVGKRDP